MIQRYTPKPKRTRRQEGTEKQGLSACDPSADQIGDFQFVILWEGIDFTTEELTSYVLKRSLTIQSNKEIFHIFRIIWKWMCSVIAPKELSYGQKAWINFTIKSLEVWVKALIISYRAWIPMTVSFEWQWSRDSNDPARSTKASIITIFPFVKILFAK